MNSTKYRTKTIQDVVIFAKELLTILNEKKILLLDGQLGAGKTALVKEIGKLLNIGETINSPSFNYMKIYDGLIHIDLYNYKGDIEEFEDYFEDNIVAIEWANKTNYNFKNYIKINVEIDGNYHVYKIEEIK
ncbi:tRNA (adenosine(37)-N6)-threonylcarbamoyltransferase complex ATPase subunit type 1 TsaE [Mycoplasma crocodyli]|uniref:tRNA threonylcarbamoyladenosine biosynthesis protein TsaE n=1 Tax=Mycoplasma crocodyli (strain ATCC 51981 / MP145) TaxID=512564 RepID=D5E4M7_MYCCM|nr:tRNA (adenosine(37)-N6)-threonylcarbamoyltransferase complex ATPase subunit type 1 TsaE [Mycoplasma crocodyli]ADE19779.1 ATP/GTP-binding protein [Mycoplasma crocodyli MP145]